MLLTSYKKISLLLTVTFLLQGNLILADDRFGSETIEPLENFEENTPLPVPAEFVEESDYKGSEKDDPSQKQDSGDKDQSAGSSEFKLDEETKSFLNAKDVDISTLVKTFSKLTKRNYIVDSTVRGKVTIHLPTAVTTEEALKIFDSVLLLKGFTTVPIGENIWKVIPAGEARQTTVPLVNELNNPSDTLITHFVRLKHVSADELQKLLSQFVSKSGLVNAFAGTNSLIMIESGANIERLMKLVDQLDVPAVDQDITIIPILHAEASDVAEKLKEILVTGDSSSSSENLNVNTRAQLQRSPTGQTQTSSSTSTSSDGKRSLPVKIIPDERTNSLIVVADETLTLKVQGLIEKLDSPVDLSGGRFHVYRLQHADAETLAQILNDLISGSTTDTTKTQKTTGSSLTRSSSNNNTQNTSARTQLAQAIARRALSSSSASSEGRVNLEGEVSIAPDPSTNSLVINSSRTDFMRVKEVIDLLDIQRRQVIVEATILEVSLNKDQGFGVEFQGSAGNNNGGAVAQTSYGGLADLFTNPAALSDLTIAAASSGTLTLPGGIVIPSQALLITAVNNMQNVNVLSSPTILTTDNEEAEIIVGENVPFVTSTSSNDVNLNNTFNQIERQDVGITLRITPQISTGNFVTLKIFVEISNVVSSTRNDPNGPTTTIRTTETTVEVQDSQMIVTGGLISDNVTSAVRGVPYLQDIPVLGMLFRRTDDVKRKTNLLVLITPKIIKDQFDAREIAKEATTELGGIIKEQNGPSRTEILNSPNLDNVSTHWDGTLRDPSTITPPKTKLTGAPAPTESDQQALNRTLDRLNQLKSAPQAKSPQARTTTDQDVLNISVKPKLPSLPAKRTSSLHSSPSVSGEASYVVLKDTNSGGLFGVVAPGSEARNFFSVGGRYSYDNNDKVKNLVVIGKYNAPTEASAIDPRLGSEETWYKLSPEELLSLGKNQWQKN